MIDFNENMCIQTVSLTCHLKVPKETLPSMKEKLVPFIIWYSMDITMGICNSMF